MKITKGMLYNGFTFQAHKRKSSPPSKLSPAGHYLWEHFFIYINFLFPWFLLFSTLPLAVFLPSICKYTPEKIMFFFIKITMESFSTNIGTLEKALNLNKEHTIL